MNLSEIVAKRVKELLKQHNMTQGKLERLSTIHHSTMCDLMSGQYKTVSFKTVHLIIKALNMTYKEFFASSIFDNDAIEVD